MQKEIKKLIKIIKKTKSFDKKIALANEVVNLKKRELGIYE